MLRRNGRLLVRSLTGSTCQLDAAQAGMLELMQQGMNQSCFLEALVESCALQRRQVESRAVLWSRHLLACIARISGARGLVGCTAVTFHPHFWWFSSPQGEAALGSLRDWPAEPCVLLLDCYPPTERSDLLKRAFGHHANVWVLRQVVPGENTT